MMDTDGENTAKKLSKTALSLGVTIGVQQQLAV
jgi:hypothetical protein